MDPSSRTEQEIPQALHCHWHPQVETGLSCSRCGKSVCTQCMVQANVGIRCKECGKAVRMPTFDVTPAYYARAVGVGLAGAVGGGVLWSVFNLFFRGIPFLPSLVAMGIGYAVGELISLAVNRKRGTGLAWIAGCSVAAAFLISWQILPFSFGLIGLLFLGIGVYMAVQRVR
ncbi:MAG: hypothetical protein IIC99_00900 [Chloroflexi bacterium]|nr:hypothetical protein [Chloroflexota bacterium]